ncbi:MAG: hypothetical protein K1X75_16640 [Leptospirales bacterium]|nr:hypothetical protein [Leptospirales bacterium]
MNDALELLKKGAAWLIIAMLAIIMGIGLVFNRGASREYMDQLAQSGRLGEFDGQELDRALLAAADSRCEAQYNLFAAQLSAQFGGQSNQDFSRFFNRAQCRRGQLTETYGLAKLGERLGLDVTEEKIIADVAEEARNLHGNQNSVLPEDRMPVEEIYRRRLLALPLRTRRLLRRAELASTQLYNSGHLVSQSMVRASMLAQTTSFDARIIRFTNPQLQDLIRQKMTITEDQIRREYDAEQARLEESQRKPYESEKLFTENRLRTRLAQEEMNRRRKTLTELPRGFSIQQAEQLLGMTAERAVNVSLSSVGSVKLSSGQLVSLAIPAFMTELATRGAGAGAGVYVDGEYTMVAAIDAVHTPNQPAAAASLDRKREEINGQLGNQARGYLQNEEILRGRFHIPGEEQSPVDQEQ